MIAEKTYSIMATQNNSGKQQLNLQRINLPASAFLIVGPSASPLVHQTSLHVAARVPEKLLLPPTTHKTATSKKRTVAGNSSLPKRKRGRPRRDAPATFTSRALAPRPILPRIAGGVPVIAQAAPYIQPLPHLAATNSLLPITTQNNSTTLVRTSTNDSTFNSSHSLSDNQLKRVNPDEMKSDYLSYPLLEKNSCQDTSIMTNNPGSGCRKVTATVVDDSFRSYSPDFSSGKKSSSTPRITNPTLTNTEQDAGPQLAICKIDSKQTPMVSSNSSIRHDITAFTDGIFETEHSKPIVIRSFSSIQPPSKVDLSRTSSVIRISTETQSPIPTNSETLALTKDSSSVVEHCITLPSSNKTESHPLSHNHNNYCANTGRAITLLDCHTSHTKKTMANTTPTFGSFGIEHDEPLDPCIVQRINERLNTGSLHLPSPCGTNSDRPASVKTTLQNRDDCSETNQFKLNESEEARRDHGAPATINKGAKKTFLCQVCGKLLNGRSNLKSHLLTHSSARPHVCHVCGKGFRRRHTFLIHERTHTNENPYSCDRCLAAFKTRSNLVRHHLVHTTKSRDYSCRECGKEFTSKLGLNAHRKTHSSGVKEPFVCSQCGEVYATMHSLKAHQLHHKYPDKQFKCKLCDKAYVFQSLLKRHMDGHNGVQKFHCHLCSTTFAWKSSLAAHILAHYPKKFKCKLCNLSFNTEKRLASHLKKHAEPNPHSCTLCLKKFAFRYLLVRHVKSAHGHKAFVTVKAKAVPRKTDMLRRIKNTTSRMRQEADPGIVSQKINLTAVEMCGEQYTATNSDTSKAATNCHSSSKQPNFSALSQKAPMQKFRCVNALREHVPASVPQFIVSIGKKNECSVETHTNNAKHEEGPEYGSAMVCYPAQESVSVGESVTVPSSVQPSNDGADSSSNQLQQSRSFNTYRKPPPAYYSASPRGIESFVEISGDSPTSFSHSSTAKSKVQSEQHEPRPTSSIAQDCYTPSYETFSSTKPFNELQSPPGIGKNHRRAEPPPHPNLLPASSDPYLQAASSTHSAYFPSPLQQSGFYSPSRQQSACGSNLQTSYNFHHLQQNYGSSSPTQQSHGGLMYLSTHPDYDLSDCLDEALPD